MANISESFDSLEAFRASERAALAPYIDENGSLGATARALAVSHAFNDWAIAEAKRDISGEELARAASFLIASMIHDVATNAAANSRSLKVRLIASILLHHIQEQLEIVIEADDDMPIWPVRIAFGEAVQS